MNTMLNTNVDFKVKQKNNITKQSLGISIPILITIMITYYMNGDIKLYDSVIEIFCASLGAALSIIAILRDDVKDGIIYKYIGYGFMYLSILSFSNIIFTKFSPIVNEGFEYIILNSTFILEYVVIVFAFRLQDKEYSTARTLLYFFMIVLMVLLGVSYVYYFLNSNSSIHNIVIIKNVMLVVLAIGTGVMVFKKGKNLPKDERSFLQLYIIFVMIYHILYFINYEYGFDCKFEIGIFKYMAYYMLYEAMAMVLLYRAYGNMKSNLVEAQKMQKELNNTLSYRNKTLIEVKSLIEKSESRYSNLIEAIKDGIIIFYFDRISYINGAALSIIDIKNEDEMIGISFKAFAESIYNEYFFEANGNYEEVMEELINNEKRLCKINICNNDQKEFEVYFLKIDNLNRLVYMKDITEINKNHELRRQYEEYLKEEKVKNEFYSNISHELRTPINLIYSALQLNEIYLRNDSYNKIEKNNETIKQNSLRLIRTINNFIDTNKISEGFFPKNIKVYNIVSIIENISLACNKYIEKIENILIFDAEEEEIFVECDKDMIERIMLNLLSNSVKYGKKGGTVLINIELEGSKVIIHVKNNGYSVEERLHPYIFDKFTKINKSFDREKEGSGLGLFLAKALTELQGGTIEFKSNDKIGTEFKIKMSRCYDYENVEEEELFEMNAMEEKVDTEFSDIYL